MERAAPRRRRRVLAITGVLGLILSGLVTLLGAPPAGATPLSPFIDLQERGLTLEADGIGLAASDSGNFTVDVGGTVRFALLYWGGTETPFTSTTSACPPVAVPFDDQEVVFNGTALTGTIIGSECQPLPGAMHIAYFADVTSIVSAAGTGTKTFSFADGNATKELTTLEGASLVVAYTNPTDSQLYRAVIWRGADFAFGNDPTAGDTRVTAAATFNHGANPVARTAELFVIAGGGTAVGTDSISVSNNATISGSLDGSDGVAWDTDVHSVNVPAGVGSTTVQPQSDGTNPDDFTWVMGAVRVPIPDLTAPRCAVTLEDPGPPKRVEFTVEDDDSGLAEILITRSENADTVAPPFTVGTTNPVVVSSTKIDQTQAMKVEMRVTDRAGNVTQCLYDDGAEQDETATFTVRLPSGVRCTLRGSLLRSDATAILRTELVSTDSECANPVLSVRGDFVGTSGNSFSQSKVVTGTSVELRLEGIADITKSVHGVTFPSCNCGTTHTITPK